MEKDFAVSGENGGLYFLLTSRKKIPEEELILSAAEEGVRVYGISDACMGPLVDAAFKNTVLLGYGDLDEKELAEGIGLLKKSWGVC